MQTVPTQPLPNQTLQVQLGGQACQIEIYQTMFGLFVNLYVNGSDQPVVAGVIALNRNRIVRSAYLGFAGDLAFVDTQGDADPVYTGLGQRFVLAYLEESDLPAAVGG